MREGEREAERERGREGERERGIIKEEGEERERRDIKRSCSYFLIK